MLPKINPTTTGAWKKLEEYYKTFSETHIKNLFENDSNRFVKYSPKFEDILVDYSKNCLDDTVKADLIELAGECGLKNAIESMFSGEKINATENRAVLHVALRNRSKTPVTVDGKEIVGLKPEALSDYRRDYLGFIFQFYNLVPNLTVKENVEVCGYLSPEPMAMAMLFEVLGLTEHQNKFPSQLSGGQQQRCAIARALVNNPAIILADEPTGNLDTNSGNDILSIFSDLNRLGHTIIIVTHDSAVSERADRSIRIIDGLIVE